MAVTPTSITLLYMKRSLSMSSIPVKRMTICASNTTIAMESSVNMTMKILKLLLCLIVNYQFYFNCFAMTVGFIQNISIFLTLFLTNGQRWWKEIPEKTYYWQNFIFVVEKKKSRMIPSKLVGIEVTPPMRKIVYLQPIYDCQKVHHYF